MYVVKQPSLTCGDHCIGGKTSKVFSNGGSVGHSRAHSGFFEAASITRDFTLDASELTKILDSSSLCYAAIGIGICCMDVYMFVTVEWSPHTL